MRSTKPITVSLPADLLRETERIAKEETRSRSEIIRGALIQYLTSRRWQRLRRWGAATAERLGIKTEADLQHRLDKLRMRVQKSQK